MYNNLQSLPDQGNPKENWSKPTITLLSINNDTLGDPTLSDDGLGDGLFS